MEPGLEFHTHHPIPKTIATKDRVGLHNLGFTEKEISAIDPTKFGLVKDQMEFNLDEIVNDELARGLMVDTIKP